MRHLRAAEAENIAHLTATSRREAHFTPAHALPFHASVVAYARRRLMPFSFSPFLLIWRA